MVKRLFKTLAVMALLAIILGVSPKAYAGRIVLDNGSAVSQDDPYKNAQDIGNIFENTEVFGKLQGEIPIGVYKFTPDKDADVMVSIMGPQSRVTGKETSQASLYLVAPAEGLDGEELGLPLPQDDYKSIAIKSAGVDRKYSEPVLFEEFSLIGEQKISVKAGKTYYLWAFDYTNKSATRYVIKFGEDKAWNFSTFFKEFGSWFKIKTDSYAGSSAFSMPIEAVGLTIFLLGLIFWMGILMVQEIFSFMANSSKAAGYILIKLQPYSRIYIWLSIWFTALGAYIFFDRRGWLGIPFVLILIFLLELINTLFITLKLSKKIETLEVGKKEATIPFTLRKRWFVSTLINFFGFIAFVSFLAIYLNN